LSGPVGWDPGRLLGGGRLKALARLVRVEHTLFSLPFAYAGATLACTGCLGWREALWIGLAVLGLRTAAMSYNNIADLDIDRANPRTASRPLVTGAVSLGEAWALVAAGSILYYLSAWALNRYALILSPLLWILAMTYPHAKRLHWLPHLHLGLVLGFVVFGGAVAVLGSVPGILRALEGVPWLYVAAVTLWVAGFDAYYAIMDIDFDREMGLGSLPARLGVEGALWASRAMHAATAVILAWSVKAYKLGALGATSIAAGIALLAYQHYLLAWRGLESIPKAFNTNLALGLVIGLGVMADRLLASYATLLHP
jgi:4-hydroxybenzoate polyprenyltransferase